MAELPPDPTTRRDKVRVRVKLDTPRRVRVRERPSRRRRLRRWWDKHYWAVQLGALLVAGFALLVALVLAGYIRQAAPPMPTD